MMEAPIEQIQLIEREIIRTLEGMPKTKSLDDRLTMSQIVKNLAEAQGVYLNLVTSIASMGMLDDDDDDDDDFYFDDDEDDDDGPITFPFGTKK